MTPAAWITLLGGAFVLLGTMATAIGGYLAGCKTAAATQNAKSQEVSGQIVIAKMTSEQEFRGDLAEQLAAISKRLTDSENRADTLRERFDTEQEKRRTLQDEVQALKQELQTVRFQYQTETRNLQDEITGYQSREIDMKSEISRLSLRVSELEIELMAEKAIGTGEEIK